ncbi:NAD(P)/FAD-dependent oxidoreductase [Pseudoxanthomonas sp. J35]|uniref:NAD(P)/FAD-dependent oxidoreductase n=1 Tax=Pseudoxanthomonas sp. J35 TaxID=935852 RepID=UPI00048BFC0D|nr:NAD(P)/FAD-dependent oxidoreductase [Pseudoxanthomonas sp. J35]
MSKFAIIGSGPMGLMAGLELIKQGHQVDIYERDDRIGGMSADFDFDGLRIERYYHFICKTDYQLFKLLEELEMSDRLHWTDTKMGYYYQGKLYKWGTPFALLGFPHLSLVDKVRYALHVMCTKGIKDWTALDKENARDWITRWIGPKAYTVMWEKAFALKFFEYQNSLSASWIGTRIKRVALSRRNLFNESMGYLEGGSSALLNEMARRVQAAGGRILLGRGIDEVVSSEGKVTGVRTGGDVEAYDKVISTAPIQYVPRLVPGLPATFSDAISRIENIPVACVILKLKHAISENFWMNISDDNIEIPGVIEYSNLNPGNDPGQKILYAPFYMPKTHPKWTSPNEALIEETIGYLPRLNPDFQRNWVLDAHCHRYEYAQTICPPGFQNMLPPMETPLAGFFMADTAYYYPEDRSINESIAVGAKIAALAAGH